MTNVTAAILAAKRNMSAPAKNKKAVYGRYADLDGVLKAVEAPLADEGCLIVHQGVVIEGKPYLRTSIVHTESGERLDSDVALVSKSPNDPQQMGSSITYARRYGITALLSIVADEDDDGNTGAGRERNGGKKKAPTPKKKGKGASEKDVQKTLEENFEGGSLPEKMVDALIQRFKRAGFEESEIVPEIKAFLDRDFGQLSNLTEAEAKAAVGHATKVKSKEAERLT